VAGIAAGLAELEQAPPGPTPASSGCRTAAEAHPAARVRLERITGPGGRRAWLVEIPGIESWSARPGPDPLDLTGAVHLLAGEQTAAAGAVVAAMRVAGVRSGEPVMLAGHSEGGMVAAALTANPSVRAAFDITHVVAFGAPISAVRVPPGVQVLSVQHTDDLVPRLDGAADPDRPEWVTVSRQWGRGQDPFAAHRAGAYAVTGGLIDASADPGVQAWRRGARTFLVPPGGRVEVVDVVVARAPQR
jgi:hypothetical protein